MTRFSPVALLPLLLLLASAVSSALPTQPTNPVIGVVTAPTLGGSCIMLPEGLRRTKKQDAGAQQSTEKGCIWSIYVDWLESSAVRVVPIPWNATLSELQFLLDRVNGVLFPGGVLDRDTDLYRAYLGRMCDIYDDVVGRNGIGDRLSLWGTCEGFQMIHVCAAGRNVSVLSADYHDMEPLMMAVNFTSNAKDSAMYGPAPADLLAHMTSENTTLNWHHLGVPPEEYILNPILNASGMVPLSTTVDPTGHIFVSSAESNVADIYAVQFHPERVMFQFCEGITHGPHAIEVSEYLSLFLAQKLQLNNHTFTTPQEAESYMIANYPVTNMGWGVRIYYV